jgi:hypothetical protein
LHYYIFLAVSGPDLIPCSGTVSHSIPSEGTSPITWNVAGQQIVSGQGTNTITVSKGTNTVQSALIQANFTYDGVNLSRSRIVSVGARYVTSLTAGSNTFSPGSSIQFTASPAFPASEGDYEWMVYPSAGVTLSTWRHTNYITFPGGNSYYTVGVRSISACTTPGTWTTVTVKLRFIGFSATCVLSIC